MPYHAKNKSNMNIIQKNFSQTNSKLQFNETTGTASSGLRLFLT